MLSRLARMSCVLLLALGVVAGAHAQGKRDAKALPIWNAAGKLEGVVLLEPADDGRATNAWGLTVDAQSGDALGLLCNRNGGVNSLASLANCSVATFGDGNSQRVGFGAALNRPGARLGVSAGTGRDTLPAWLSPNRGSSRVVQNDLIVHAQKKIGEQSFVTFAGTLARARLVSPTDAAFDSLADQWDTKSISFGAGRGNFSTNVIGQVIEVPGQPKWEGLGVGVTWRTPWSGQLTVGADNVVTRGKNPFSLSRDGKEDEGAVPYVRYEQDL